GRSASRASSERWWAMTTEPLYRYDPATRRFFADDFDVDGNVTHTREVPAEEFVRGASEIFFKGTMIRCKRVEQTVQCDPEDPFTEGDYVDSILEPALTAIIRSSPTLGKAAERIRAATGDDQRIINILRKRVGIADEQLRQIWPDLNERL